ncbi:MAG: hypothetical protein ACRD20_20635 [Terriglobales bacterium]
MTVSELALVIQHDSRRDISAALVLTAEAIPVLKLSDGTGVRDASDFRKLLEELAEALNPPIVEAEFNSNLPARDHLRLSGRGSKTLRQEQPRNWNETT